MTTGKLPAVVAALALLAFTSVLFFPALFEGKILAPLDITTTLLPPWNESANGAKPLNHAGSDAVSQYLPYRVFAEKSLREDGYIGWNPYEMGGYSLAANTMALPGSWPMQLHRFLTFTDAWNLGIVAEFLIAGIGMLAFLRGRRLPWLPCLIGAVAFAFNAQFIVWIYHRWALGSFCWMPWVLWSFGNGFARCPTQRRTLLLPGFLALALLGGSLQHTAFIVLACGCVAAGNLDLRRPLSDSRSMAGWSLVFVLSLGMAAFSLVPQVSGYLSNLAIGHVRGGIGYPQGRAQVLFHTLVIPARIWPWLFGDTQTIDGWKLLRSYFMDLNYLGTIPMLLAFVGLFLKGVPRAAKWLILVGLLTPLTPLVGPLYHRVELLFILGGAWMAAEVLARLPRLSNAGRWPRRLGAAVAALGVLLLIGACIPSDFRGNLESQVIATALSGSTASQYGADKTWIASRAVEWTSRLSLAHPRTAWVYGLLVLGVAGLALSSRNHSEPSRRAARSGHLMILCATALELATLFRAWTTFCDPADLHPQNAAIETVRSLAGPHRVLQSAPGADFASMFATPNVLASFLIPSIDGYESIHYRSSLTATKGSPDDVRLTLAGVGLAIQPSGYPQPGTESWPIVARLGAYTVRKNPRAPPPIAAGSEPAPATPGEIEAALSRATPIEPSLHTSNRWAFNVPAGQRWIRIAQNWHPGWQWRSPGLDWRPFRNGADAVCWIDSLPESAGRIEVRFFPRPRGLALASIGAALVWLCLVPAFLIFPWPGRPVTA
jgi:hypothetical protein